MTHSHRLSLICNGVLLFLVGFQIWMWFGQQEIIDTQLSQLHSCFKQVESEPDDLPCVQGGVLMAGKSCKTTVTITHVEPGL